MVKTEEHLTMQYISIALELNVFKKKFKKFIRNKNIIRNTYRIPAYECVMCGYFCIGFTDLMLFCLIIELYFLLMNMKRMIKSEKIILRYLW